MTESDLVQGGFCRWDCQERSLQRGDSRAESEGHRGARPPAAQGGPALPTEQQRPSPQAGRAWEVRKQEEIQWTRTIVTKVYILVEINVKVCKLEMY